MPELPEVENRLVYFQKTALGETIERVVVTAPGMIKSSSAARFARSLAGRRMCQAERRGKYLIITLDDDRALILHFGMGGELSYYRDSRERPEFTRIEFFLASGARLAFTCPRKICRVLLVSDLDRVPALKEMGPEPLASNFSLGYLERVMEESPARQVKPLLMDQRKIAGVGNIYADEILFKSGVRPDRLCSSLVGKEIERIHRETRRVLRRAIGTGGDQPPEDFLVSRSWRGARCRRCRQPIEKKTIGGRTSYFCPECQR
ncbi:MAG TPA: DNA-formamidopyrimidine glycosylase [Blastocatellia bacterium]|nr:DNA-formamidopyrimidine glycosylase [Blastocatellia bacterium]